MAKKLIEIARLQIDANLEKKLEKLMNTKAKDYDLLNSFGPVTSNGKLYVFFIFQKMT